VIRNGKDIANRAVITTQVCIIGSGPAGITAAWHLQQVGIKVVLIEGSRDYRSYQLSASWPDKVLLYNGMADGLFANKEREFLILPYGGGGGPAWERERVYGGTSAHWAGQCRPLDSITFEKRWDNFPSWPVSRQDLDPYYAKAAQFLNLDGDDFSVDYWANVLNLKRSEIGKLAGYDTEMYQFVDSCYTNFSTRTFGGTNIRNGTTIGGSPVDVILNASLLNIDHDNGVVRGLCVASMTDETPPKKATEFFIKADVYVLACGAVANARQLLLANVKNEHDLIGRYFMCHPIPSDFEVVRIDGSYLNDEEEKLVTGYTQQGSRWTDKNAVKVEARFSPDADAQKMWKIGGCWFGFGSDGYYFEMAPNPDSRVTLDTTTDPVFGQPQSRINWELTAQDEATYTHSTLLYKNAIEKRNKDAKVWFAPWEELKTNLVVNGHHIGTTRMSDDAADGVVDANLKVHSLENLYVAGASVFRSAGISNPTFTIVTLSIRLAEHLIKKFSEPRT